MPVSTGAMTKITLSFLLSLLSDFQGPEAPANSKYHWAYKGAEGPDSWHRHYKHCSGERQSPVDIFPSSCEYDLALEPVILEHFDPTSESAGPCIFNVTNNGHAASVRVISDEMRVKGGGLGQTYKTVEFHFHWGSSDHTGSEHAISGRKFPLEMHVVSFAEKYGTVKQAMTQPDGLAVMAVFFELSEKENMEFSALDEALRQVHKAGKHTTITQLRLRSLLPDDLSKFWRYNGSLTTPFCFESVIWTVFAEPQKISKLQLETLRSLLYEEGHEIADRGEHHSSPPPRLMDNWRPLQPLNGRVVKRSFGGFLGDVSLGKPSTDTGSYAILPSSSDPSNATPAPGNTNPSLEPLAQSQSGPQDNILLISSNLNQPPNPPDPRDTVGRYPPPAVDTTARGSGSGLLGDQTTTPGFFQDNLVKGKTVTADDARVQPPVLNQEPQPSLSNVAANVIARDKEVRDGSPALSSLAIQSSDLNSHGQETNRNSQLLDSTANQFFPGGASQQNTNAADRGTNLATASQDKQFANVHTPETPRPLQEDHKAASQRHQEQPSLAQTAPSSPVKLNPAEQRQPDLRTSSSIHRIAPVEARIAELANQIRLHRQSAIVSTGQANNTLLRSHTLSASPPVVRHHQVLQSPGNNAMPRPSLLNRVNLLSQSRQPAHPSPSPQLLRAILERLAATSRITSQRALAPRSAAVAITSGAASIPRVGARYLNSLETLAHKFQHQQAPAADAAHFNQPHPNSQNRIMISSPANAAPPTTWFLNLPSERFANHLSSGSFPKQPQWPSAAALNHPNTMRTRQIYSQPTNSYPVLTSQALSRWPHRSAQDNSQLAVHPSSSVNTNADVFLYSQQEPARVHRPMYELNNGWRSMQQYHPPAGSPV